MSVIITQANNPAPPGALSGSNFSLAGLFTLTGVEDTLTAHAGGTQAAALALSATKNYHRISVCATAGDSVLLPPATVGQSHFVRNDGAASCQVYGTSPDTIDGVATATGVAVPAGVGRWFVCTTAAKWYTDDAAVTTGSGANVLATSPTLVTPVLGVATATSINKLTLTQPANGATLTLADGSTLDFTPQTAWTPAIVDASSAATIPAPAQAGGHYMKIGKTVFFEGYWEAGGAMTGTLTGNARLSGLPVAGSSYGSRLYPSLQVSQAIELVYPADFKAFACRMPANVQYFDLYYLRSAANVAAFSMDNFKSANMVFYFSGFYFTD